MNLPKIKYYIFVPVELLRKIVFPISLVYALVVRIRNYLYDVGIFKSRSFKVPIVCIGNLSTGGTGKTPMVEMLIDKLQESHKTAVLSRGYKRHSRGFLLAERDSTVQELGDEPFQIHSKYPHITVAVDGNRTRGVQKLQEQVNPEVILLDDGFQHRKVKPHLSLLLTPHEDLYINDWYLPTGNLRDSKSAAKRADLIVVTKCPVGLTQEAMAHMVQELHPLDHQEIMFSTLDYGLPRNGAATLDWQDLMKKHVTVVTGIAKPEPFLRHLSEKGLLFEHLDFPDHHDFSKRELDILRSKEHVLTTEKDYMRLKGKLDQLSYIPVKHVFLRNGLKILEERLENAMRRNP